MWLCVLLSSLPVLALSGSGQHYLKMILETGWKQCALFFKPGKIPLIHMRGTVLIPFDLNPYKKSWPVAKKERKLYLAKGLLFVKEQNGKVYFNLNKETRVPANLTIGAGIRVVTYSRSRKNPALGPQGTSF